MKILHFTRSLSVNSSYFATTALVATMSDAGHQVLMRHFYSAEKNEIVAKTPTIADDIISPAEFESFDPDAITFDRGIMMSPSSDEWRLPESVAMDFVERGGVILVLDVARDVLTGQPSMREDLRFFGATVPDQTDPCYLEDPNAFAEHPSRMLLDPTSMWIDARLKPAFDDVKALWVWGAVPLTPVGEVAASTHPTARTLHMDVYLDAFAPAPIATVRQHGNGFAGVITGVTADDNVAMTHPDNLRWIRQLLLLLHERAHLMVRVRSIQPPHVSTPRVSLADMLAAGESENVEYKQTARWNVRSQKTDKKLEDVIVKTVCGFLNAHGGSLLIGVSDDGVVVGLEADMATLSGSNRDAYELFLRQLIDNHLTTSTAGLVRFAFEDIDSMEICVLSVRSADAAVFALPREGDSKRRHFYVRTGNATKELHGSDLLAYEKRRWG